MLVVTRHQVGPGGADAFLDSARSALAALAARPGFVRGTAGRAADDESTWVLVHEWVDTGSYRRALSAYDVKVAAVPLLSTAADEPTAFEVLLREEAGVRVEAPSARAEDAGTASPHDR